MDSGTDIFARGEAHRAGPQTRGTRRSERESWASSYRAARQNVLRLLYKLLLELTSSSESPKAFWNVWLILRPPCRFLDRAFSRPLALGLGGSTFLTRTFILVTGGAGGGSLAALGTLIFGMSVALSFYRQASLHRRASRSTVRRSA